MRHMRRDRHVTHCFHSWQLVVRSTSEWAYAFLGALFKHRQRTSTERSLTSDADKPKMRNVRDVALMDVGNNLS